LDRERTFALALIGAKRYFFCLLDEGNSPASLVHEMKKRDRENGRKIAARKRSGGWAVVASAKPAFALRSTPHSLFGVLRVAQARATRISK
jgi:hypothetical protein